MCWKPPYLLDSMLLRYHFSPCIKFYLHKFRHVLEIYIELLVLLLKHKDENTVRSNHVKHMTYFRITLIIQATTFKLLKEVSSLSKWSGNLRTSYSLCMGMLVAVGLEEGGKIIRCWEEGLWVTNCQSTPNTLLDLPGYTLVQPLHRKYLSRTNSPGK